MEMSPFRNYLHQLSTRGMIRVESTSSWCLKAWGGGAFTRSDLKKYIESVALQDVSGIKKPNCSSYTIGEVRL